MRVWIDAQLSPALARCLRDDVGVDAIAVRELGLRSAEDPKTRLFARFSATRGRTSMPCSRRVNRSSRSADAQPDVALLQSGSIVDIIERQPIQEIVLVNRHAIRNMLIERYIGCGVLEAPTATKPSEA